MGDGVDSKVSGEETSRWEIYRNHRILVLSSRGKGSEARGDGNNSHHPSSEHPPRNTTIGFTHFHVPEIPGDVGTSHHAFFPCRHCRAPDFVSEVFFWYGFGITWGSGYGDVYLVCTLLCNLEVFVFV